MSQKKRVVFITGGAGGIGLAIGEAFANSGATVVLCDLDEKRVKQEAANLSEATGVGCDITDEKSLTETLDTVIEKYGKIDVLINNAGLQFISPVEEFPTSKFEQMIKVMLTSPFMAIKHVFPVMKRERYGKIINMASINGLIGFCGKAAYNSAKHGLIGLTKVTALEGAPYGINVNALCPGYVDTPLVRGQLADLASSRGVALERVLEEVIYPLVPQKRLLTVEEVADYALFLASDRAGGIVGQAAVIDGGYTVQ